MADVVSSASPSRVVLAAHGVAGPTGRILVVACVVAWHSPGR